MTLNSTTHGTVTASEEALTVDGTKYYSSGDTITLTASDPDKNYRLGTVTVAKADDSNTTVEVSGSGNSRTFVMPEYNVNISSEFEFYSIPINYYSDLLNAFANGGKYILMSNLYTSNASLAYVTSDVTLDLNGKSIINTSTSSDAFIIIKSDGKLTLNDSSENKTGAIICKDRSCINVAVAKANLVLKGGTITGKAKSGGGVIVHNGTFKMSGGKITGCTATGSDTTEGGGVYVDADSSYLGYFTVYNTPVVTDNTANGKPDDIYLNKEGSNTTYLSISKELKKEAALWVSNGGDYDFIAKQKTTSYLLTNKDAAAFRSSDGQLVIRNNTKKIYLAVSSPKFSPAAGTYAKAQTVTISCPTEGADIYYTTDGTTPTASSTLYTDPITIDDTTQIKAIAIKEPIHNSFVTKATYTIDPDSAFTITVNNGTGSGDYAAGESVTLTANAAPKGKVFKKWTGADGLTFTSGSKNTAEAVFTMPAADVTLTAEYGYADNIGARLAGNTISLEGDIGVNFYMELSPETAASESAYMKFTIPAGSSTETQTVMVSDAEMKDGCYVFKCSVDAKEMTSEIKAQIIDGDKEGTEYTYSVKEYADYLLSHTEGNAAYAKAAPLVKAMLNYGAYSQLYFGKNTDNLANADLTEAEKQLGDVTITHTDLVSDNLPEGVTFEGTSLVLKTKTELNLFFKNTSENDIVFKLGGEVITPVEKNGYLQIKITGINAKELSSDFTLSVGESGSVTYSPMNYCKNVLNGDYEDDLKNVVKALYLYYQAADDYFD